jgi:phage shock protein A
MEMHALQPRVTEAGTAHASLTRQINELTTSIANRSDVPADVKTSVESLGKELAGLAPKLTQPAGGRGGGGGGGRGGANESLAAKLGTAKSGYMATMSPGEQTTTAYSQVKAELPKAIADLNATIAKAAALRETLSKFNLTLTVPQPIKVETPPARKTNSVR